MIRALLLIMKPTLRKIPGALQHTIMAHSHTRDHNLAQAVVCMGLDSNARMWATVQDVRERFWGMPKERHAHCVDGFIF